MLTCTNLLLESIYLLSETFFKFFFFPKNDEKEKKHFSFSFFRLPPMCEHIRQFQMQIKYTHMRVDREELFVHWKLNARELCCCCSHLHRKQENRNLCVFKTCRVFPSLFSCFFFHFCLLAFMVSVVHINVLLCDSQRATKFCVFSFFADPPLELVVGNREKQISLEQPNKIRRKDDVAKKKIKL